MSCHRISGWWRNSAAQLLLALLPRFLTTKDKDLKAHFLMTQLTPSEGVRDFTQVCYQLVTHTQWVRLEKCATSHPPPTYTDNTGELIIMFTTHKKYKENLIGVCVCTLDSPDSIHSENPGRVSFNMLKSIKSSYILSGSDKRRSVWKCF